MPLLNRNTGPSSVDTFNLIRAQKFLTLLMLTLLFVVHASAQTKPKMEVVIQKFTVNEGDVEGASISLIKNGGNPVPLPIKSKLTLSLDMQANYVIRFSKPGYITKSIEINTTVPQSRLADGFEPFPCEVKLFKQYEGVNIVVFSQPVAKIYYNTEIDEFDYNVDYTKAIQSKIALAEDELEQKVKEEKKGGKKPPVQNKQESPQAGGTTAVGAGTNANPQNNKQPSSGGNDAVKKSEAGGNSEKPPGTVAAGSDQSKVIKSKEDEDKKKLLASKEDEDKRKGLKAKEDEDARKKRMASQEGVSARIESLKVNYGSDSPDQKLSNDSPELVSTEHIEEANRTIDKVTIKKGPKTSVYKYIKCSWGGEFYFKDDLSISKTHYERATTGK